MRLEPVLAAIAGAICACALLFVTGTGKADDPPITTTTVPDPVEVTVQGKTAQQWHRVAARYLRSTRALVRMTPPWGTSWRERATLCIHSHEGSWTDPNPPYFGGVQMDLQFARTYAAWALRAFGTPDKWPVVVQMSTAIQAQVSGRGFKPWPKTARMCGLL